MEVLGNVPVLPSRDLARSERFYLRLGYRVESRYDDYLILRHGAAELHLARMEVEPARNPAGLYLRVRGVDEIARLLGRTARDMPWGQREVAASDPDENLLRFGEAVAERG